MAKSQQPHHFVVDGSNIATEGRSEPSLEQLNEAVLAFMADWPDVVISVVVDATFGHRIAKNEVKAFDEAVANNELVTPPAGAIGRGDAFVLSIANKANAGVLSNDSFQEFHGEYDWLFDEGRLIGGKPVPHVGWVFVARTPVRGPKSRRAVREAKTDDKTEEKQKANRRVRAKPAGSADRASTGDPTAQDHDDASSKPAASKQSSKQSTGRRRRGRAKDAEASSETASTATAGTSATSSATSEATNGDGDSASKEYVNELMPFLEFVGQRPVGSTCTVVVESYASHGAYARMDDVLIYLPLRLLGDPAPRSARSVLTIGESMEVVIVGFTPDRRSIDAAVPAMAKHVEPETTDGDAAATIGSSAEAAPVEQRAAKRTPSKRKAAAKKTPAKKTAAKRAPAKKTAAKKTAAKKNPAKRAPAKTAAAKKAPAKRAPAKKAAAKRAPAKKAAAKRAPAKKVAAKKTTTKPTAARKTAAKKSTGS